MLVTKRTYKNKYVIGGAGIFDSIGNFFVRMFSSNAAKQLVLATLQAGKTAAIDNGIDVGKTVAIDAGKKLVENAAKRLATPKSQVANIMIPSEEITKKVNKVVAKYSHASASNLNKQIDGLSVNRPTTSNAIAIQDLVRRLNGSGLKATYIFFLLLKMMADMLQFTESVLIDESIEKYEYHEYDPITGINLNPLDVISRYTGTAHSTYGACYINLTSKGLTFVK